VLLDSVGMDLKDIEIRGEGNNVVKLVKALENLPDGTIGGISGYGHVAAAIDRSEGPEVIRVTSRHRRPDYMNVTVPNESACSIETNEGSLSFVYRENTYRISPVGSSKVSEQ